MSLGSEIIFSMPLLLWIYYSMPLWLIIYLVGCLIAFALNVFVFRDKKNRTIAINDFIMSLVFAVFSWIMVIALWVGWYIKKRKKDNDYDDDENNYSNDEDDNDFYNNTNNYFEQ
jgi:hypothetical protein